MFNFVMFGNLASSLLLDAIGAFGFEKRPPTALRSVGLVTALLGATITSMAPAAGHATKRLLQLTDLRSDGASNATICSSGCVHADTPPMSTSTMQQPVAEAVCSYPDQEIGRAADGDAGS